LKKGGKNTPRKRFSEKGNPLRRLKSGGKIGAFGTRFGVGEKNAVSTQKKRHMGGVAEGQKVKRAPQADKKKKPERKGKKVKPGREKKRSSNGKS